MGVFVSLDFFLFYVFWEVMLLPMYFLIGIWGGPRREYAAIKFFLYTLRRHRVHAARASSRSTSTRDPAHLRRHRADAPHFDAELAASPGRQGSRLGSIAGRLGRALRRLRDQDPDVPVPHLAARRARRGADGDQRHPRRRAAQDGHLRHPAHQLRASCPSRRRGSALAARRLRRRSTSSTAPSARWRRRI